MSALAQSTAPGGDETGSKACAGCHAEIYRKYSATGMARTSGRAGSDRIKESFEHAAFAASGAEYRVDTNPSGYRLAYSRPGVFEGERKLEWYIGSGNVGRSYLVSVDGFLFQAPVSYYAHPAKWDLSPGYQTKKTIDLTRAVEPACLQCHASRLRPIAGTQNRFETPPFLESGIGCERCHGPGKMHIDLMMAGARNRGRGIVNPARLDAARRDSVCAQCHLTGAARIARAGRPGQMYRPGDLLSDHLAVFVWSGKGLSNMTATSHYEKLAQSACKQAGGDRLWCGSCHDPHDQPRPAERAAFFRSRCLSCHQSPACKESMPVRRKLSDDCAGCHMPKSPTQNMEHIAFTDHAIPRRPGSAAAPRGNVRELVSFFGKAADGRDLALAYAIVAATEPAVRGRALELLKNAESAAPDDIPVLSQLAQFYDRLGDEEKAMDLCERISRLDPANHAAATNLAIYWIKRGRAKEAITLWENALMRNPGLTGARINLAVAEYRAGNGAAAETAARKALEYDPDNDFARKLLYEIRGAAR
jgi:hypothetical protein